jgi:monoamine oxidase
MSAILVIGAGAAGLAAARELTGAGKSVCILEARDRIGGRIHSLVHSGLSVPIELGAEFVHGMPLETMQLLSKHLIAPVEVGEEQLFLDEQGKIIDTGIFNSTLELVLSAIPRPDQSPDMSFAEWLAGKDFSHDSKGIAMAYVEGFNAADANEIGIYALLKSADAADRISGHRQFRLAKPYSNIVQALLNECNQDLLELQFNAVVESLTWSENDVQCKLTNGTLIAANQVIVTLPLPVLQQDKVKFIPALEEKKTCLDQLAMGHAQRLIFSFKTLFWESISVDNINLAQLNFIDAEDGPFRTWWTLFPVRAPILVGWNSGPDVTFDKNKDELTQVAIAKLATIFNIPKDKILDEITSLHYHDWSADPFALGAYSYSKKGGADAPKVLAQPIKNTLYFAGEATDFEGNSGFAHGAIASGIRAAKEVLSAGKLL